jgi:tol-pal system protein YbgF
MARLLAPCVLVLVASSCFFPADRGKLLEARVDTLEDQRKQLETALVEAREKLEKTTSQLQDALAQLDTASRTTGANIGVKVDSAIQDAASLRGQLESTQYRLQELEQRLDKLGTSAAPPPDAKKDDLKRPDDPKEFLKLADEKAKGGDTELARKLYTEFLKKWPRDEGAGEAHFGLGETWFGEQKCREALYEYGKVIQEHAKTRSAPAAYLHSADCFKEMKMIPEAKLALEEVQAKHPKSDAARTAKQKLADLAKAVPKGGKK